MSDQRVQFIRGALIGAPGSRVTSVVNPLTFIVGGIRYSAHISPIHDSGEGRDNDDEERIQIPRGILEAQHIRRQQGDTVLFLGFFTGNTAFTAWEPNYALAQKPGKNGSVYARRSHGRSALAHGAVIRVVNSRNLGRSTTTVTMTTTEFSAYLNVVQAIHNVTTSQNARNLLSGV